MASLSAFLNVQDIERSLAFYQGLGFKATDRYEHEGKLYYVSLEMDGAILELGNIQANDDPSFRDWVSGELGRGVVLYLSVDDVDDVFDRAITAGAVVEHKPEDRPYGRTATINDPDGYTVGLIEPAS